MLPLKALIDAASTHTAVLGTFPVVNYSAPHVCKAVLSDVQVMFMFK